MFTEDFEEARNGRVNIADIDEAEFAQLLQYIYTGQVANMKMHALGLLVTADMVTVGDSLTTPSYNSLFPHQVPNRFTQDSLRAVAVYQFDR